MVVHAESAEAAVAPPGADGSLARARVAAFRDALGDDLAFRAFYAEALPRVYGYVAHRCQGNRAVAEDVVQTAFTEAVRRPEAFDGRSDAVTWIIGIARHKLADHFREQERDERRRLHLVVRDISDDVGAAWRDVDERDALLGHLSALTAAQRAVLILHYADGLPVREVARELGRSESATESLLARAREALRARYEELGDD